MSIETISQDIGMANKKVYAMKKLVGNMNEIILISIIVIHLSHRHLTEYKHFFTFPLPPNKYYFG